ncbi:MAG TPA: 3-oxoacyl-ACP reductase [Deltaproteobacteria bacterium]|nr:3-oxoacyl-ACP reductase [Deltaproteobacteria bacterium]
MTDTNAIDVSTLFDLSGKTALVTGGSRGIGKMIAEGYLQAGATVYISSRKAEVCDAVAAELSSLGPCHSLPADFADDADRARLVAALAERVDRLDILVNNAGVSARIPCEAYPDDNFDAMVELNLGAVFRCMREAASRWIDAGRPGRIINLASFAGMVADPLSAPYAATKGAVVQLTRTCAVEWASHGILVNAIGPGYVRTEMTAHTLDTPEAGAVIRAKTALGRAANTSEMAGAAVYLASAASSYTTGHILMVDGGWTAM